MSRHNPDHEPDRDKWGNCRVCLKVARDIYRKKHGPGADKNANARKAKWRKANAERNRSYNQAWNKANPDKVNANGRRWREANPGKANALGREWRKANPDKMREIHRKWVAAHPEYWRVAEQRRRARERSAPGKHGVRDIRKQLKAQRSKCYWCKVRLGVAYHVDHVIPLCKGGSNGPENIVLACAPCNLSKGQKMPSEFAGRLL